MPGGHTRTYYPGAPLPVPAPPGLAQGIGGSSPLPVDVCAEDTRGRAIAACASAFAAFPGRLVPSPGDRGQIVSPRACGDTGSAGGVDVPTGMSPQPLATKRAGRRGPKGCRGPKGWRGPKGGRASGMGAGGLGLWWLMGHNGDKGGKRGTAPLC